MPLYDRLGIKRHTYREIVWQWFVLNRPPQTNWDAVGSPQEPRDPAQEQARPGTPAAA